MLSYTLFFSGSNASGQGRHCHHVTVEESKAKEDFRCLALSQKLVVPSRESGSSSSKVLYLTSTQKD